MTALEKGQQLPDFRLQDQNELWRDAAEFRGRWLVLYFYPKDNTPGCTTEAKDFSCLIQDFAQRQAQVLGVSPDKAASHQRFIAKQELNLTLLSDPKHQLLQACGAWGPKKFMGREYDGVIRSTFLVDPQGVIRAAWTKVRVKDHATQVLKTLSELQNQDA